MNGIRYILRKLEAMLLLIGALVGLTACDSVIYDDEGDCDIHYRLRFRFDYNLMFADAFPAHVHSVAVYAFNPDGTFAWERKESGTQLAQEGYTMNLDGVPPGDYDLVAWCGMDNGFLGDNPETFSLPDLTPGVSTKEELQCRMDRIYEEDGTAHSRRDLWPLFHGATGGISIIDPNSIEADGQTITYTCELKKNTNRVRVILQQLSGRDINSEGFTYTIESGNGLMAHTNELLDDDRITYHAWNTTTGSAGINPIGGNGQAIAPSDYIPVKVAIADLTVGRLVTEEGLSDREKTRLTVYRPDGGVAARIPLVDYALLVKDHYFDHPMTDQEYLDREDTYTLTFFLDENNQWGGARIVINSWRVVRQIVDLN